MLWRHFLASQHQSILTQVSPEHFRHNSAQIYNSTKFDIAPTANWRLNSPQRNAKQGERNVPRSPDQHPLVTLRRHCAVTGADPVFPKPISRFRKHLFMHPPFYIPDTHVSHDIAHHHDFKRVIRRGAAGPRLRIIPMPGWPPISPYLADFIEDAAPALPSGRRSHTRPVLQGVP